MMRDFKTGQVVKLSDGSEGTVVSSGLTHFTGPFGQRTRYKIRVERGTEVHHVAVDDVELDMFNR